jgi:hypothetical protein
VDDDVEMILQVVLQQRRKEEGRAWLQSRLPPQEAIITISSINGYNPAYKYDFIFDTIISNVNAVTRYACLDLCGDETTYAHEGYGEKDTSLVTHILNKPGVTRGGQIVVVDRIRPRAYLHHHKCHVKDFKYQGSNEVKHLLDHLDPLIIDMENLNAPGCGIFRSKPHITFDNFFSGKDIATYDLCCEYGLRHDNDIET